MRKLVWVSLVLLSACACPRTEDYGNNPYEIERTAGSGMVHRGCLTPDFR